MKRLAPLLVVLLLGACSWLIPPVEFTVVGSSTVMPAIQEAAKKYNKMNPRVKINVEAGGSAVAVEKIQKDYAEIGMLSRALTEDEKKSLEEVGYKIIPIGIDAIVPIVSKEIYDSGVRTISKQTLAGIYRGEITNWNEIGERDHKIIVVDHELSRGTRHVFMEYLFGDKEAPAAGAIETIASMQDMQDTVGQDYNAIGYISFSAISPGIQELDLETNEHDVHLAAEEEGIRDGSYPIVRQLSLIVRDDIAENKPAAQLFIDFLLSGDGQYMIEKSGYLRLEKKN